MQLLNETLTKNGNSRGSDEIFRLFQHSKRISDSARRIVGSTKEDLISFIKIHPAFFIVGFNGADVQARRILPPVKVDLETIRLPFDTEVINKFHAGEKLENDLKLEDPPAPKTVPLLRKPQRLGHSVMIASSDRKTSDAQTQTTLEAIQLYSLLKNWLNIREVN